MLGHVNAPAAKGDAFVLETEALFHARGAAQFDMAAGAYDTVPGNRAVRCAQGPRDLPGLTRVSRGARHVTVSSDFALRDFPHRLDQFSQHAGLMRRARLRELLLRQR